VTAADVGEAADVADDLAESVGTLPRDGEGSDASRAVAAGDAAVGIGRELHGFADFGEDLFDEKAGVLTAEGVIFEAAVFAGFLPFLRGGDDAGIDEDADGHGDVAGMDEIVEHGGGAEGSVGLDKSAAVEADEDAGRFGPVILGGDIDPVVALGAGENGTLPLVLSHFPLRDAFLDHGVGTGDIVLVGGEEGSREKAKSGREEQSRFHVRG
jgi:hypothetical protein